MILQSYDLPNSTNAITVPLTALLSECGMAKVGREVKDALGRNAVWDR